MYKYIPSTKHGRPQSNRFGLSEFLGADLRSQMTDIRRSPETFNMIWGKNPHQIETRAGYIAVLSNLIQTSGVKATIYGIFPFIDETHSQLLVHAGTAIYLLNVDGDGNFDGTVTSKKTGLGEVYSTSFMFGDYLYILAGKYLRWDGESITEVENIAYTPITMVGATPSFKWTDTYYGDGTKTDFTLSKYDEMNIFLGGVV